MFFAELPSEMSIVRRSLCHVRRSPRYTHLHGEEPLNRRDSLKIIAAAAGTTLLPAATAQAAVTHREDATLNFETRRDAYAASPTLTWLPMGDVRPAGWLREQMLRDLTTGIVAGCVLAAIFAIFRRGVGEEGD